MKSLYLPMIIANLSVDIGSEWYLA